MAEENPTLATTATVEALTTRLETSNAQLTAITTRLEASTAQLATVSGRCDALEARCESLATQLATAQRAISSVPSDESIRESVNKRFVEAEAARGHGSAIKGAADAPSANTDPKERARERVRNNPAVLHFSQGER